MCCRINKLKLYKRINRGQKTWSVTGDIKSNDRTLIIEKGIILQRGNKYVRELFHNERRKPAISKNIEDPEIFVSISSNLDEQEQNRRNRWYCNKDVSSLGRRLPQCSLFSFVQLLHYFLFINYKHLIKRWIFVSNVHNLMAYMSFVTKWS